MRFAVAATGAAVLAAFSTSGCMDRDIYHEGPRGFQSVNDGPKPEINGVDLLLVVDDSLSMADKHQILKESLSHLSGYATRCFSMDTHEETPPVNGKCPPEHYMNPILPTHISQAVIRTSLEAGGLACANQTTGAHPLPKVPGKELFGIQQSVAQLPQVGESGCSYQAPLEAVYRFLVDPEPPLRVSTQIVDGKTVTVSEGVDQKLLEERAEFLRPLSQVLIVILTDEDDCSVRDDGDAWKMGAEPGLARGNAACDTSPSDRCCRSCDTVETVPPEGCTPLADDPVCASFPNWPAVRDPLKLRCFNQKRRFGKDWLLPIERYSQALKSPTVVTRTGETVPNPLFAHGRTPDSVSVLLLGGVPWQRVTTPESELDPNVMEFLSPEALVSSNIWPQILGDPQRSVPPSDPHLLVSVEPRSGLPGPEGPLDPIHGHEAIRSAADDLQYSCTFQLPAPRGCAQGQSCECNNPNLLSPLCLNDDGSHGTVQRFAGAKPPSRLLQFVQSLGPGGFVGSICSRQLDNPDRAGYGYSEVFRTFYEHTYGSSWDYSCFDVRLPLNFDGSPRCQLLERHAGLVDCVSLGRIPADPRFAEALPAGRRKGNPPTTVCAIPRIPGDPREPGSPAYACSHELHPTLESTGYCYIEPSLDLGSSELVEVCHPEKRRRVRLVPSGLPLPGVSTGLVCDFGNLGH